MIVWEWRRIFRQKIRSFSPKSPLSYQQWSRRRLIMSFVLFFAGWKMFGVALNDMLLWKVDPVTGECGDLLPNPEHIYSTRNQYCIEGRFLSPAEGKRLREEAERARLQPPVPVVSKHFPLDA